jgi:hypothetical protein
VRVAVERARLAAEQLFADAQRIRAFAHRRQGVDAADEVGDEKRLRVAVDVQRRAHLLDRAFIHHDDAVGHREGFLLVVRDHDGSDPELPLQAADFLPQLDAHDGVQRRQRLVQQQQAG